MWPWQEVLLQIIVCMCVHCMQFYLRVQPDEDAVAASPKKTAKPKKAMKRPAAVDHTKEPEPSEQAASDEGTRTCVHRTPKLSGFVTCV